MLANQAASIIAYQRKEREQQAAFDRVVVKATTFSMQLDAADKLLGVATRRGFFK